jgi:hypothetical protein
MNHTYKTNRKYIAPMIEKIQLDNEISLQLQSIPPTGPGEPLVYVPEYFNQDPFKTNRA